MKPSLLPSRSLGAKEVRALAHPLRLRMLESLADAPATASMLGARAGRVERRDQLPPARARLGGADHRGPRTAQGPRALVEARPRARRPDLLGAGRGSGVRRGGRAAREHDGRPRRGRAAALRPPAPRGRAQRLVARDRVHRRLDGVRDPEGGRRALRVRRPLAARAAAARRSSATPETPLVYVTYRALPQTPTAD